MANNDSPIPDPFVRNVLGPVTVILFVLTAAGRDLRSDR
jgi:hypothetical protein